MQKGQSIETITLEEALELFKLPVTLGDYESKEVSVNMGRFGPYVKWGDDFISIPKGEDPMSVELDRAIELITEKQKADTPIAYFQNMPITKGKGRFGPFIKWNDMFINVPRRYNFENLSQGEIDELINTKIEKEANRFIQQWPAEKIALENGRWGPFIRFGKKMLKIGRKENGEKYSNEEVATLDLETVKKMIDAEVPGAFTKAAKKAPAKKKALAKKKAAAKKK